MRVHALNRHDPKYAPCTIAGVFTAACIVAACLGCRFSRSGSQAIDYDPFGSPALSVADGSGYDQGMPLDQRH